MYLRWFRHVQWEWDGAQNRSAQHTVQGLGTVLAQHHGWREQVTPALDVLGFGACIFLVVAKQTLPNSASMPVVVFWGYSPPNARWRVHFG
jgi:hypothetical protein